MSRYKKVPVTVELDPIVVLVLDAIATHLQKDRSETVADALRCYFAVLPRPDDAPFSSREDESGFQHEASKPGGTSP